MKEIIDVSYFTRISAIIVSNGKMYVSDCDHQEALEMLCADIGKSTGFDWKNEDFDTVQEKAIKLTDSLFQENKIQGFDIFEGYENQLYLTAHYPENLEAAGDLIRNYAKENNCILGTFTDSSYKVTIID